MRGGWIAFGMLGCGGGVGDGDESGTDDVVPPAEVTTADCVVVDNPLVVECSSELAAAGAVTLTLTADGLPTRTFTTVASGTEAALIGWGLRAETTYAWEVEGVTGTVVTGALPPELGGLSVQTTGTLFGADGVLVYVDCGWFLIVDSEGEVIWTAESEAFDRLSDGMMWSQPDRSLLTVRDSAMSNNESLFVEVGVAGDERLRLLPGTDFSLALTHDVGRWGPYTYLLGEDTRVGGFEVWEGTEHLGTWLLSDAFSEVGDLEVAHVNGLTASDEGEVVISALGFNAVLTVDGDPASPTFLQMLWHARGVSGGGGLPNPDFTPESGDVFERQHNASVHGDELWVFDNGSASSARAVRLSLDAGAGTLTELDAWPLNQQCMNQGGAMPLDGGVLATCANTGDVSAFRDGADTPEWTLHASCGGPGGPGGNMGGNMGGSTRAFPVQVQ